MMGSLGRFLLAMPLIATDLSDAKKPRVLLQVLLNTKPESFGFILGKLF